MIDRKIIIKLDSLIADKAEEEMKNIMWKHYTAAQTEMTEMMTKLTKEMGTKLAVAVKTFLESEAKIKKNEKRI